MKRIIFILIGLMLMNIVSIASAQVTMPDYVIRTAQEINAIYGEGAVDINNVAWDWRGGSIGDNFPLSANCTSPITLPTSTIATGYYRVFFDTNFDGVDEWVIVVYSDYSYFGLCTAPRYECGSLLPLLTVGGRGHVDPEGIPNNLRAQAGESGQLLGEIPPSGEFTVLDGPRCASGMNFWLVDYNGSQGWSAEGQGQAYWLISGGLPAVISVDSTPINPTPVLAPTAISTVSCAGVTSRLYVGLTAQVTPGLPNNLRAQPGESGAYLGEIPPGIPFQIIGGPQCNSNLLWWQVNYQGTLAWTAEAGSADDYWLEPVSANSSVPITTSTVSSLTSVATLNPPSAPNFDDVALFINTQNEVFGLFSAYYLKVSPLNDSWSAPIAVNYLQFPFAAGLSSRGQVEMLLAFGSPMRLLSIGLEDEQIVTEFNWLQDGINLETATFHPNNNKMIVIAKQGQGPVFIDANPESPSYRGLSQAARFMSPNEIYTQFEFSDNGLYLVGLTDANNLIVWTGVGTNYESWTAQHVIIASEGVVINDIAINPDGSKLVVSGLRTAPNSTDTQGFYTLYNVTIDGPQEANTTYFSLGVPAGVVEFTPDGTMFAIASRQTEIAFVDATTYNLIHYAGTSQQATDIVFSNDATAMATASALGNIIMWRIP